MEFMLGPARLDKATGLTGLLALAGLQAVKIVTLSPKAVYLTGNRNGYRCTVCEYDWVDEHPTMKMNRSCHDGAGAVM